MNAPSRCDTRGAAIAFALALLAGAPLHAATIHVSTAGSDANSGLSWSSAKRTVQAGLDTAASGEQVWVAAGTYVENITLKLGVALCGGFAGTETALEQRDWTANVTILDGNQAGSVVSIRNSSSPATRIDGFTIRNGTGTPSGNTLYGGGIYADHATVTIANNTITGNTATAPGNYGSGGGIYGYYGSLTITNNTITGNSSPQGGGFYCWYGTLTTVMGNTVSDNVASFGEGGGMVCYYGPTIISDNTVAGNSSTREGGGMDCYGSPLTISGNTIRNNTGGREGGGIRCRGTTVTVTDNTISGNTTSGRGGGVHCSGDSVTIRENHITGNTARSEGGGIFCAQAGAVTVADNVITGNRATTYSECHGGGVMCYYSPATVTGNTIEDNHADGHGGGIYCLGGSPTISGNTIRRNDSWGNGGGISAASAPLTIAGNTIANNSAGSSDYGGGIYTSGAFPKIVASNTISGNTARYGGGICCETSWAVTLADNTVIANSASAYGSGLYCTGPASIVGCTFASNESKYGSVYVRLSTTIANCIVAFNSGGILVPDGAPVPVLRNNCVYDNDAYNYSGVDDPTGTDGNISADPRLAAPAYGNVHLQPDSPCIDAGDDSLVQPDATDIDGQPRVAGQRVDIGADESDGTAWPGGPNAIVRVSPDGDDANDGSSWSLAKRTVQAAIEAASSAGGEVWVQAGTYPGSVRLRSHVYLYGGFAGTEAQRAERNWSANRTILDGSTYQTVATGKLGWKVGAIDGFTIRNGTNSGIACEASIAIRNNTITGNLGQGIRCAYASPLIANNIIAGNLDGGILCVSTSAIIANNTVVSNVSRHDYTAGISCSESSPVIINTIIAFNSSGILVTGPSNPSLRSNCVYGNGSLDYSGLADPAGTDGNISADPKLAARPYGDLHIQPDSPCIDAGDNSVIQPDWQDIDAQGRIGGARVDIGADESDGTAWPGGPNAIVRVSPAGDDANDGSSWGLAKRTVQAAIDAAAPAGGDVWVQAGTYVERVTLKSHVHLFGGFAGSETQRSSRDWSTHVTTLDGSQGGSVVTASGIGPELAAIDGFTIRNGKVSSGYYSAGGITCSYASPTIANNTITANDGYRAGGIYCEYSFATITNNTIMANSGGVGGGICCVSASPTITNNVITDNVAVGSTYSGLGSGIYCGSSSPLIANNTISSNIAYTAGAVYCADASSPTITGNSITNNQALDGGGLYLTSKYTPTSPSITLNTIIGNTATRNGGGVFCQGKATPTFLNNMVRSNSAAANGGGIYCNTTPATFAGNVIAKNSAIGIGGGFYCTEILSYDVDPSGSPTIADNTISENTAAHGGGIGQGQSLPTITGNTITANRATSNGGGIYCTYGAAGISRNTISANTAACGGGIYSANCSPVIRNNIVVDNSATPGGGLYCSSGSPWILHNTIVGNGAVTGGGIHCSASAATIANTLVAFNSSGIHGVGSPAPTVRYSCVYGNAANYTGLADLTGLDGNVSADPLFIAADPGPDGFWVTADDVYADLHLQAESPCRNAGDPAFVPAAGESDIDNQPRVMADRVDIGADEFTWTTDSNLDGYVDVVDLLGVVYAFGTSSDGPGYDAACDFNRDGVIDVADLLDLVADFGK